MNMNTVKDKKIFLEAILNPPAPNDALKKAHLNYLTFKGSQKSGNHKSAKNT